MTGDKQGGRVREEIRRKKGLQGDGGGKVGEEGENGMQGDEGGGGERGS